MPPRRMALLLVGLLLSGTSATAQRVDTLPTLRQFTEGRIRHEKTLGFVLGSYALANIAVGGIAAGQTSGETRFFHRMNAYWNVVNLGLAGLGLLGARQRPARAETPEEAVRQHQRITRTLVFNAGLDVAYVVGGAYLLERAHNHPDKADQLRGYGKSVMLQGGFLFAFDLANYLIFKHRGDRQERLLLSAGPAGVGVQLPIR